MTKFLVAFFLACAAAPAGAAPVQPARIIVRTIPERATVSVDGTPIGAAEVEYGVVPGRHIIVAELPGHEPARREVEIRPGQVETISLFLLREERQPEPVVRVLKWSTLGLAVAATAAGIALLAVGDSARFDAQGRRLPESHDNTALGAVFLGAGVATGALSGYLFYRDRGGSDVAVGARWIGMGVRVEGSF